MALLLKNLLFTVLVPGTVAVYLPLRIAEARGPASLGPAALALPAFAAGAAIYAWCVWDFASFGRGTPAPIDAPKRLVVRGLYRYTRNPMYLGVLTVILGWALLFQAEVLVAYAGLVGTCFHLFVVLYEERQLRHAFGEEYQDYCGRVGRWLPRPRLESNSRRTTLGTTPLRKRPLDAFLVFCFCVFAVTSLIYEQFVVFGVDLSTTTDIFGRSWYWYARSFDPVFLDPPLWLRIMCGIDAYLFGACYLVFIFAFVKGRNWVRVPALLYGSAIVYSTIVYFGWEFLDEANRAEANLLAVFIVNIPYTLVPLLLIWRVRHSAPFAPRVT